MHRRVRPSLLVVSALSAFAACADQRAASIESTTFAESLAVDLAASTRTPSGVWYRDLVIGDGPVVANGQQLAVRYTGWLANGTRFDGNEDGGPAFSFVLGRSGLGGVIDGWNFGIAGQRVGTRRQLIIPPDLGYGPLGNGPIPPNAILVFSVEVLSAQ
jgi:FKBP-type peptidyl-prolyl cis-trans isomerase FkpA